jgi:hypothetical protein
MNLVVVRMALILQRLAQNVTTEEGGAHKEKMQPVAWLHSYQG